MNVLPLVVLALTAFTTMGCSESHHDLFVWDRPVAPLPVKLPITQSASCRFKKTFAVGFHEFPVGGDPNGPRRVYYSASDEGEADTLAFLDLDTNAPKVRSNRGQESLQVLYKGARTLTLIHAAEDAFETTDVYTIFLDKGVVILSLQGDAAMFGPYGEIEMGYCN